jgi:peptidoglycan/LPS O-acetylase OafA/YrhL
MIRSANDVYSTNAQASRPTMMKSNYRLAVSEEEAPAYSRTSTGDFGNRLPSLDGFRAISISLVLLTHFAVGMNIHRDLYYGDLGVRCFFVISGFLITHLLLKEEAETGAISLRLFYARRFLRIVPVYLLFISCLALLTTVATTHLTTCDFITSLTYTKDFGCREFIDNPLWSLSVEEQFYLIWPLVLLRCSPKNRMMVALGLIGICPIVRIASYLSLIPGNRSYSPFTNADMLMFGCMAALLLRRDEQGFLRSLKICPMIGRLNATLLIVTPILLERHFLLAFLTVPFAWTAEAIGFAYLICSYAFVPTGIGFRLLNSPPARFVGVISYSIYIWHEPFFTPPQYFGIAAFPLLQLPMNAICVFVVSTLSYCGLERPLARLRNRLHVKPRLAC